MRLELRARQEAHIVARDRGHAPLQAQVDDGFGVDLFGGSAGALHFEVEPIAAQFLPSCQAPRRLIIPPAGNRLSDVAVRAAGQDDQSLQHLALQPAAFQHGYSALLTLQKGSGSRAA